MCGESGTSRTLRVHRYYKCVGVKKRKTCKKKSARKLWLEDLVINATMQMVMDDKAIDAIIAKLMELQDKEPTELPHYEQQLREATLGINNLLNAI